MIDALAVALETTGDGVPQALKEKLAHQNLVLLHPCIVEGFDAGALYRLLHEVAAWSVVAADGGALKCLQPIEWPISEQTGAFSAGCCRAAAARPRSATGALELMADAAEASRRRACEFSMSTNW